MIPIKNTFLTSEVLIMVLGSDIDVFTSAFGYLLISCAIGALIGGPVAGKLFKLTLIIHTYMREKKSYLKQLFGNFVIKRSGVRISKTHELILKV